MTWTKPECEGVNGITSYVVKYQRPGDPTVNEKVFKASDCCKVNVALTAETQYRVWVVTRDSTGKDGDASAATLVTTGIQLFSFLINVNELFSNTVE